MTPGWCFPSTWLEISVCILSEAGQESFLPNPFLPTISHRFLSSWRCAKKNKHIWVKYSVRKFAWILPGTLFPCVLIRVFSRYISDFEVQQPISFPMVWSPLYFWDLRFSQWCCWTLKYSGIWGQNRPFWDCLILKITALRFFETSVNVCQS
jgi:hypothetical protein